MSLLHIVPRPRLVALCCRSYASKAKAIPAAPVVPKKANTPNARPVSACPANTVIEGVNYLKGQPPVLALPDEEYPAWLWTCLAPKVYEDDGPGGKFDKQQRRKANRQAIRDRNFMSTQ